MLTPTFFAEKFHQGRTYPQYLDDSRPDQRANWQRQGERASLTEAQRILVSSFVRRMHILVSSGIWCGDCAAQVPLMHHIASANPLVQLRLLDRDEHADLSDQIRICGGLRVPTAVFLTEDFEFVSIMGDKTLSRLRAQAPRGDGSGASCELPTAVQPMDLPGASLADWLGEFERVQLILRLSPKLRARHGD